MVRENNLRKRKLFFLLLPLLYSCIPFINSQITLETEIENNIPTASTNTYSRYADADDNFPLENFTICIGETNKTIFIRFVATDRNSRTEIQNATWKIVSVIDNQETTILSFGNSFKQAAFESTLSATEISYLENITLTNNGSKTLYKITTNVTDVHNDSSLSNYYFTLHKTECIRVEENASLVESEPYTLQVDYTELDIVVNENITGRIIITLHNQSPVDSNTETALDKYITIDVVGIILQKTINLSLIANYTQSEVESKGIDESSLQIYKFGSWNLQEGSVDTLGNQVSFTANHTTINTTYSYRLGTYSIRGDLESNSPVEIEEIPKPIKNKGGGGGGYPEGLEEDSEPSKIKTPKEKSLTSFPKQLFDIAFMLEERIIYSSDELRAIVTFESFGNTPTQANLTFIILDKAGKQIYLEKTNLTVITEEVLLWNYDTLQDLQEGAYTAILQTLYNDGVFDEFSQGFEVRKKSFFFVYGCYLSMGILLLLIIILAILLLSRRRKNKKEKKKKSSTNKKKHAKKVNLSYNKRHKPDIITFIIIMLLMVIFLIILFMPCLNIISLPEIVDGIKELGSLITLMLS